MAAEQQLDEEGEFVAKTLPFERTVMRQATRARCSVWPQEGSRGSEASLQPVTFLSLSWQWTVGLKWFSATRMVSE